MRFVTFLNNGAPEPGVVRDSSVVSLKDAGYPDIISVIAGGAEALSRAATHSGPSIPLSAAQLLAPIPRPGKIFCIGLNYRDHAIESNMEIPKFPTVFSKFTNTVIGPGAPIVLPRNSEEPDYEAELAFVIGKGGRHIPAEKWADHVFGYTCLNDVSARDYQLKRGTQWLLGKTFDTFAPMGPYLVTAGEIADPHNLDISIVINGEVLQNSNTRHLIFGIPDLVSYLSGVCTLEPGDVVSTGTPSGVGFARKPPRWLKAGDEVVVRVAGVGELRNPVVAEAAAASA